MVMAIMMVLSSMNECSTNNLSIRGNWVNNDDNNYVVKITKDRFYEIYNNDTSFYKYSRSSESCDKSYLNEDNNPNLDFISLDDGRCFEITGLTDSTLAYRHTASGRMQVFYKAQTTKAVELLTALLFRQPSLCLFLKDKSFCARAGVASSHGVIICAEN